MEWKVGAVYKFVQRNGHVFYAEVLDLLRNYKGVYGLKLLMLYVVRRPKWSRRRPGDVVYIAVDTIIHADPLVELEIPQWLFEGG